MLRVFGLIVVAVPVILSPKVLARGSSRCVQIADLGRTQRLQASAGTAGPSRDHPALMARHVPPHRGRPPGVRRVSYDWQDVTHEDEAFFLRVYGVGDFRFRGTDLGILVTKAGCRTWRGSPSVAAPT